MISMTGYTKQDFKIEEINFSLSIQSLNSSKGCDITIKTPRYLIDIDSDIRNLIRKELVRGKINFLIKENSNSSHLILNKKKVNSYIKTMTDIVPAADPGSILNAVIKLPDIFLSEKFKINTKLKNQILKIIVKEIRRLNITRTKEGKSLQKEITKYINIILKSIKSLVPLEIKRHKKRKRKILTQFKHANIEYNPSRLESEMIYYFERNDITEERVRLQHHCNFFLQVMRTEEIAGKKLNFIAQEILREINTIGSKANDFQIQKRVVKMKEQIEKIKEQIQNIL
tara:strand:+ start:2441 stop:3295 length:855 start_codon:yes stop_codon:yes gene_type:complete